MDRQPQLPSEKQLLEARALLGDPVAIATLAIMGMADDKGLTFKELMDAAEAWLLHGEYLCDGGRWESESLPDKFWDHYGTLKEVQVPFADRESFFTCSC